MQKKSTLLTSFLIAFGVAVLLLADLAVGQFYKISFIGTETAQFVNEVAPLITTTNHLLPNLNDRFSNQQEGSEPKRLLRTDEFGLVLGASEASNKAKKTVLFLGGSTTENNEVSEQFRFPYLSMQKLTEISQTPFQGVNAGVRGHTTQDSINLFLNHPAPYFENADYVVLMHNINDRLRLTLNKSYKSGVDNAASSSLAGLGELVTAFFYSSMDWIRVNSNIAYLLDMVVQKYSSSNDKVIVNERVLDQLAPVSAELVEKFRQNYKIFIALVKAKSQVPVLMTQPLGKTSNDQARFNEVIRNVAAEEGVMLIDLELEIAKLDRPAGLFYDDWIHFNDNGSRWASEIIARNFRRLIHQ